MNVLTKLQAAFREALAGLADDPAPYVAMVKPTADARHGDYQANCAMSLAKALKRKPPEVAREIIDRLPLGDWLQKPEIAGPGFINVRLRDDWLARQLRAVASDERLGVEAASPARTYVVDYSSPNVAKPMHVGHLRSTIIGDALARLLRFLGHAVITDNHLGDWGTQFGILLYGYKHFLNKEAFEADPVRELARLYVHVRGLMKGGDEEDAVDPVAEACRQETAKLHAGDPENVRLWQTFMPYCLEEIDRIYRRLDVRFDHTLGESFYNPMLPDVVRDLEAKGIAEPSEGAVVIFLKEDEPPALIRKRDGAFTYTTTDLATVRYRVTEWHADAVLYAVDARQALHFRNLFDAARRWGYDRVELRHISFGSVLGRDRKPFAARAGGAPELSELLDEAVRRAGEVYRANRDAALERGEESPDLTPEELRRVTEAVGLGAVKYADLSQNRTSDYVFDWDKMLAMDGNTATYMQYAYARVHGIFRKGNVSPESLRADPPAPSLGTPHERALAVQLLRLSEALGAAAAEYVPNAITAYLWDLAKTYSGFFQNCPVLRAETDELRAGRLLLCDLTGRTIGRCLDLLGIRAMERI
ncbi:MAG TPA: arginine--tRNA ligase [Gemmataceae bacterium]|nr:arginine--tRNA ligase [Gemmataceae bacterium]